MTTIQITREGKFDGCAVWKGQKLAAQVTRRSDGTPLCYTVLGFVDIPTTHAVELVVNNRREVVIRQHAPRLSRRHIAANIVAETVGTRLA